MAPFITRLAIAILISINLPAFADDYDRSPLYPVKDSRIEFRYNHARAPQWLSEGEAIEIVKRAAERWSSCGVQFEFAGSTESGPAPRNNENVIGWSHFLRELGLSETVVSGGLIVEADMTLNARHLRSAKAVESTIIHEFGHWAGISGHSVNPLSVMNLYSTSQNSETVDLGDSDIAKCKAANHSVIASLRTPIE